MCPARSAFRDGSRPWLTLVCLALLVPTAGAQSGQAASGDDLYHGRASLTASLRGDDSRLPAAAVICAHCHEPSMRPGGLRQALAPRLDAQLKASLPRRGGPASSYDEAAFCHLMRTGVDPGGVLVRKAMPTFELTDAQCADLWEFVSRRAPPSGAGS